tara:strand:- start:3834 stop:3983 length:150 start_codon:yes stop_codon:yes gene_type:complete
MINEYIWDLTRSNKLIVISLEIIEAIGGPKTIQHVKAKNKSLSKTRIIL